QEPDLGVAEPVYLAGPEILHDLLNQRALVRDQVDVEAQLALESVLHEHALAETVDCQNAGLIQLLQRLRQATAVGAWIAAPLDDGAKHGIVTATSVERGQGFAQACAHARAQLRG